MYYAAMAVNALLRCTWIIPLAMGAGPRGPLTPPASEVATIAVTTALALAEITRRCAWSFFRVEAEQGTHLAPPPPVGPE